MWRWSPFWTEVMTEVAVRMRLVYAQADSAAADRALRR